MTLYEDGIFITKDVLNLKDINYGEKAVLSLYMTKDCVMDYCIVNDIEDSNYLNVKPSYISICRQHLIDKGYIEVINNKVHILL